MTSKSQTAPTGDKRPEKNGAANGRSSDLKVKVEDKMDEGQLTRLATGVAVDTGPTSSTVPFHKPEKAAFVELRKGIIQIIAVENDRQPRSLVILTGLKTLFQTQLPMMPREYIARLVYDSNSKAIAIIKRGYKVVGGICYRPFPHRGFAEIVFFATASVDQVKGYGGMLMDNFKQHIKRTYPDVMHFLTYADNFAVVFFKKQGFSKEITLDRSVWAGYIKDYEGGTIMQCTMLRKVNYLEKVSIISQQREAILAKIREMSKSHIVYHGLPQFQEGAPEGITVDPKDVPGLRESGWIPGMENTTRSGKSAEHTQMQRLLSDLKAHPLAWAFLNPVNADEVPDYYGVIKRPMDFSTMEHKLDTNQYSTLKVFLDDVQLVLDNCKLYNPETSIYHRNAVRLEKFTKEQCAEFAKRGAQG
ncbi:Bromodomain-containing protein [Rhizopogon vinicolor AM-OR11-026]|uniref:histone acetyltransferase n=1 Tax=Rhizopogon vinicolor AM-OR11-026 TaxID=1314800 RepID=A0A1B7NGS7_9AGAM|nr:Bromodomain-containing protein [Rhizopogon vinicolor AM-OR11-026]